MFPHIHFLPVREFLADFVDSHTAKTGLLRDAPLLSACWQRVNVLRVRSGHCSLLTNRGEHRDLHLEWQDCRGTRETASLRVWCLEAFWSNTGYAGEACFVLHLGASASLVVGRRRGKQILQRNIGLVFARVSLAENEFPFTNSSCSRRSATCSSSARGPTKSTPCSSCILSVADDLFQRRQDGSVHPGRLSCCAAPCMYWRTAVTTRVSHPACFSPSLRERPVLGEPP